MKRLHYILLTSCICAVSVLFNIIASAATLPLNTMQLPKGFHISVYTDNVPGARQMTLGNDGTVYIGSQGTGKVYALVNNDQNFNSQPEVITIASGLNNPNGVAFRNGKLYVAETNRILRYDNIADHLKHPPKPTIIRDQLPNKRHHGLRYIKFGPDNLLYMGVGAPCNVCISKNPIFGTIVRMQPDGKNLQIYATGIRNTVGFAWSPVDNKLWFTDNGRDWLGDNLPPDELNTAPRANMNFGFPYFYGKNKPDPKYGRNKSSKGYTPSAFNLPAHVAALGMIFYTGTMLPKQYHNQILIAEHGSWNRSKKTGYRVSMVAMKGNKPVAYQPIIKGWRQGQSAWGRPVDLLMLPDGSLLISDDYNGVIYRLTYDRKG